MRKSLLLFFLPLFSFISAQNNALVLNGAYMMLNGGSVGAPIYLVVNQPNILGITRPGGGHINSENQYNFVEWVTSTNTGSYVVPFGVGGTATDYIPMTFNKSTASNITLTVSTYSTNAANNPFPGASISNGGGVGAVSSMPQALSAIDRFWDVRTNAGVTADLYFSYRGIENTITSCPTDTLKMQNWNGASWNALRGPGNPGVTVGIGAVGPVPTWTTYAQFALTAVPISPTITSSQSVTCNGASTGSAVVNTTGGLGPYSYTWSPSGGNSGSATGLGAGNYTVTVAGSNGCSKTSTINIAQPSAITLTANQTTVTCASLASATVTPSGGTPGYTYTWSPSVSTTNTATGLTANNYTVTVSDANSCSKVTTVTISSNTIAPNITATPSGSLNCTTTTVQVSGSTTTTPVSYTWSGTGITGGNGTGTITVNQGGTYNLTVTNTSNGCSTTTNVSVTSNTATPNIAAIPSGSINCATTTVQIAGSTTTTPVSYTWSGVGITAGNGTGTITVNQGGVYTLTVTNTLTGCKTTTNITINSNTTTPNITATPSGSLNCTTTTVQVVGSTTATPVSYTWSGSGITAGNGTGTITVNQSGTYNLTVTNTSNGCSTTTNVAININTTVPTVNAGSNQTLTCVSSSVTLSGTANPSTVTVSWLGGVCGSATSLTTAACAPGVYTLSVTNPANNCSNTSTVQVAANASIPSVTVANTGTINCINANVQIVSTTTASPVSYTWSGTGITGGNGTGTVTVNQGGTYTLTIVNTSNGCSSTVTNSVTLDNTIPSPTTAISGTITCATTSVDVSANAGGGSYTYTWSGSGILSGNGTPTVNVNQGGVYTVTVANTVNGCTTTANANVTIDNTVPTLTLSPTSQTLSCSTPTAQISVSGTASSYTWTTIGGSIVSGSGTSTVIVNGAGNYDVIGVASNGCTTIATASVLNNSNAPIITLSSNNATINCSVTSPTITAISSATNTTYTWSPSSGISSGVNGATATFTNTGSYTLAITDNDNGCTTNTIVNIVSNTVVPTASSGAISDITCTNTLVTLSPNYTPSSGLTYTWTGSGITGSVNNATASANAGGTYTVSFVDPSNGCSNSFALTINTNTTQPTVTISPSSTTGIGCSVSNQTVSLTANGSGNVSYNWNSGLSSNSVLVVSTAGTYSVIVTDNTNGCSAIDQYSVTSNIVTPNLSVTANAYTLACGSSSTSLTAGSTNTNVSYSWSGPSVVSGGNTPTVTVGSSTGIYTVTVTDNITQCTASETVSVYTSSVVAAFNTSTNGGVAPLPVTFTNTSTGATSYTWTFGNGSSANTTNANTTYNASGIYTVTLIASDGNCVSIATTTISVLEDINIDVPNIFTPNGDGVNDVFFIRSTGVKDLNIVIFDRWGLRMFEGNGPNTSWDGKATNGQDVPTGTYFYILKATGYSGKEIDKQGYITLTR